MKNTLKYLTWAFATLLVMNACKREELPAAPDERLHEENLIEMTIQARDGSTKSTFDGKRIGWELTDEVAVYDGTAKRKFTVTAIQEGTATLKGLVADGATEFYAVYPYSAAQDALPQNGKISVNVPQEQTLAAGKNFDGNAFVTAGKVIDGNVTFLNAVSVLRLNIPSGVTSVTLKSFRSGVGGDKVAGAMTVTYTAGAAPSISTAAGAVYSPAITLTPSGTAFEEGVHYIALIPGALESGFKVVFAKDGKMAVKKNTSKVNFPLNGGNDITAYTTADQLTWLPNPIMSEADLLAFVANQDAYAGEEALLGQDITLTKAWTPANLTGVLDGGGHTLSGLDVHDSQKVAGCMFSVQPGAVLKNLTVEGTINVPLTGNNPYAGLIGKLQGTLYRVVNKVNVSVNNTGGAGQLFVGGLAGYVENGTLSDCTNEGTVEIYTAKTQGYAGGVAGVMYPGGLIEGCTNKGTVVSKATSTNGIGGVIGTQQGGVTQDCHNEGTVSAESMRSSGALGGVVGALFNNSASVTSVQQCSNQGTILVSATGFMGVGGVVGSLSDGAGATPMKAEIVECKNTAAISFTTAKLAVSKPSNGFDGFYVGGILGVFNVTDASTLENAVRSCQNSGNLSVTTSGNNNAIKVGGICGNTRGTAILEKNENTAASVSLVSESAAALLCSAGGIVGETGNPWQNETTSFTLSGNINRASVLSRTNATENPAGGLIGYCFGPVTASGNTNFGAVTRDVTEGAAPDKSTCFAGGLVGFFAVGGSMANAPAWFESDKTFGNVSSYGRAGLLFGGLRSSSYAGFKFADCVVAGHLISGKAGYDLDITSDNYWSLASKREDAYVWGFLPGGHYNFDAGLSVAYGNPGDY